MKDYRQYTKPYKPNEWEKDKDWMAKRLEFLWTLCDYYPELYCTKGFGHEKETIYTHYGSDNEVAAPAYKMHYGQYETNAYNNLIKKRPSDVITEYCELEKIKNKNMDKFLRKRIYIKYYFYSEFIESYLYEEYGDYIREYTKPM